MKKSEKILLRRERLLTFAPIIDLFNFTIMKKYLFLMLALAGFVFSFSSCSSDDDKKTGPIVGTWISNEYSSNDTVTFSKEGVVTEHSGSLDKKSLEYWRGTYDTTGDKLMIQWSSAKIWNSVTKEWSPVDDARENVVITFSITGNTLKFLAMQGEKDYKVVTFQRQ